MRRVSDVVAFVVVGIVAGAVGNQALQAQSPSVKNTPVLRTDMTGLQGMEGYLNIVEQDPGGIGRKQYHTGDVFFYVIMGSMMLEMDGKPSVTVNQGQAFHLDPKTVITPRNASTAAPVKFLVFGLVGKGQPPSVQVP
jgi:quercetin dioxygenase-like cupin family protein